MTGGLLRMARSIGGAGGRPEVTAARSRNVIKIAISQAAFEAITETMPLGSVSVGHENESNERGERLVWLDRAVVNRLGAMRGPGESDSDVIQRLAKAWS
jgi:hypothetical protein